MHPPHGSADAPLTANLPALCAGGFGSELGSSFLRMLRRWFFFSEKSCYNMYDDMTATAYNRSRYPEGGVEEEQSQIYSEQLPSAR